MKKLLAALMVLMVLACAFAHAEEIYFENADWQTVGPEGVTIRYNDLALGFDSEWAYAMPDEATLYLRRGDSYVHINDYSVEPTFEALMRQSDQLDANLEANIESMVSGIPTATDIEVRRRDDLEGFSCVTANVTVQGSRISYALVLGDQDFLYVNCLPGGGEDAGSLMDDILYRFTRQGNAPTKAMPHLIEGESFRMLIPAEWIQIDYGSNGAYENYDFLHESNGSEFICYRYPLETMAAIAETEVTAGSISLDDVLDIVSQTMGEYPITKKGDVEGYGFHVIRADVEIDGEVAIIEFADLGESILYLFSIAGDGVTAEEVQSQVLDMIIPIG